MIAVAENEVGIASVNDEFKRRRRQIRLALRGLGLDDPGAAFPDLWMWYGRWRGDPDLTSYQSRRELVITGYQPVLEALDGLGERHLGSGIGSPQTGWTKVDAQVRQLRQAYATAETPEQFRQVGLLCRDIMISLGRVVFDPDAHIPEGADLPKRDDAKNRIQYAIAAEFPGKQHSQLRGFVKAAWTFVQDVLHDETEDRAKASIAADGTIFLVSTLTRLFPAPTGHAGDDENWDEVATLPDDNYWEPPDDRELPPLPLPVSMDTR